MVDGSCPINWLSGMMGLAKKKQPGLSVGDMPGCELGCLTNGSRARFVC